MGCGLIGYTVSQPTRLDFMILENNIQPYDRVIFNDDSVWWQEEDFSTIRGKQYYAYLLPSDPFLRTVRIVCEDIGFIVKFMNIRGLKENAKVRNCRLFKALDMCGDCDVKYLCFTTDKVNCTRGNCVLCGIKYGCNNSNY